MGQFSHSACGRTGHDCDLLRERGRETEREREERERKRVRDTERHVAGAHSTRDVGDVRGARNRGPIFKCDLGTTAFG